MKKILLFTLGMGAFISTFGQQATDKKFQLGIGLGGAMNFNSPESKTFTRNGVGGDFIVGLNLNYNITNTIGIFSGIEFDLEGFKYKNNNPTYYLYDDTEIYRKKDDANNATLFSFTERKYSPKYLTIPTMFLFRTQMIGYFRYFGKFGVRNSFLIGNKITDQGSNINPISLEATPTENDKMKVSSDLLRYKGAIGLAGGVEWNFTGTTSLCAELGYYYGFTNIHIQSSLTGDDDKNKHLFTYSNPQDLSSNKDYKAYSAKQGQLQLKVSILF